MADIREQDLALKTTIADTDWLRLVNQTGNHRMTVGQFKDLIGYTALQQKVTDLEALEAIESISNLNTSGTLKLTDGTMIAWGQQEISGSEWVARSSPTGGGFYSPLTIYNLPEGFINTPIMFGSPNEYQIAGRAATLSSINAISATQFRAVFYAPVSHTSALRVHWIAIGKWK